jgi:hypothetical protein
MDFFFFLFMKINTAEFVISNSDVSKCPERILPEYAFIGQFERREIIVDKHAYQPQKFGKNLIKTR